MNNEQFFEANRELWNSRVSKHVSSDFYDVNTFRNGKTSLNPPELALLPGLNGKSLLHLQCHFGMDTLSLARMGAVVTGVDISDEAITAAEKLRDETGLKGRFIACNLYDLPQHLDEQFDFVFTSYGTIGWLPDLDRWAALISRYLKPGGRFIIADFHPVLWMFDEALENVKYHYFNKEVIESEVSGSYAARESAVSQKEYGWNHSFGEIFSALLKNGLTITHFEEYPYSPYNCFQNLVQREDRMWVHKTHGEKLPMMYTLTATRL